MARDILGNKRSRNVVTQSDVRMEYVKGFMWFLFGYLYFHFIIMGWGV